MEKLVRDNIPKLVKESGNLCTYYIANDDKYKKELDKKLKEEIKEYCKAKNIEDKIEELVDVQTVIDNILEANNISKETFDKVYQEKLIKNGDFKNKYIMLIYDNKKKGKSE